ncbi:hypothetical protein QN363_20305, partial [Undibacterium sp. CCC2.1]|uniref:hypothetical protein n=1 Tax=Undibacterium sp. CCC2.1 TaxID=3048604 RepID=UPI002B225476
LGEITFLGCGISVENDAAAGVTDLFAFDELVASLVVAGVAAAAGVTGGLTGLGLSSTAGTGPTSNCSPAAKPDKTCTCC